MRDATLPELPPVRILMMPYQDNEDGEKNRALVPGSAARDIFESTSLRHFGTELRTRDMAGFARSRRSTGSTANDISGSNPSALPATHHILDPTRLPPYSAGTSAACAARVLFGGVCGASRAAFLEGWRNRLSKEHFRLEFDALRLSSPVLYALQENFPRD
jgi:hypothetical protein